MEKQPTGLCFVLASNARRQRQEEVDLGLVRERTAVWSPSEDSNESRPVQVLKRSCLGRDRYESGWRFCDGV